MPPSDRCRATAVWRSASGDSDRDDRGSVESVSLAPVAVVVCGRIFVCARGETTDLTDAGAGRRVEEGVVAVIVLWALTALLTQPASALDFEVYRTQVEPIFLEKKAGFTRCVVCHTAGRVGFLEELSSGATTWDEEQSRKNFEAVSRLVTPGQPLASRLLMHPLEPAAGGDEFHNGGRQFTSQDDPQFQRIAAWVRGQ